MTQYLTIADAQTYMDTRLHVEAWEEASDTDKDKALIMATRIIDGFNYLGDKSDEDQDNQFPRGGDIEVSEAIEQACAEIALRLLEEIDPDMEIQNSSMQSSAFASVKTTYNREFVPEHQVNGVPSPTAWSLLKPYLRDVNGIAINRVS